MTHMVLNSPFICQAQLPLVGWWAARWFSPSPFVANLCWLFGMWHNRDQQLKPIEDESKWFKMIQAIHSKARQLHAASAQTVTEFHWSQSLTLEAVQMVVNLSLSLQVQGHLKNQETLTACSLVLTVLKCFNQINYGDSLCKSLKWDHFRLDLWREIFVERQTQFAYWESKETLWGNTFDRYSNPMSNHYVPDTQRWPFHESIEESSAQFDHPMIKSCLSFSSQKPNDDQWCMYDSYVLLQGRTNRCWCSFMRWLVAYLHLFALISIHDGICMHLPCFALCRIAWSWCAVGYSMLQPFLSLCDRCCDRHSLYALVWQHLWLLAETLWQLQTFYVFDGTANALKLRTSDQPRIHLMWISTPCISRFNRTGTSISVSKLYLKF